MPWVDAHLLHLARLVDPSHLIGQDSVHEYILRGTELIVAAVATAVWSLLDRSWREYRTLDMCLRVLVHTALVTAMLFYGLAKVPPAQFGMLSLLPPRAAGRRPGPMSMLWLVTRLLSLMLPVTTR